MRVWGERGDMSRRPTRFTEAQAKADAAFRAEIAAIAAAHHEAHLNRPPGDGMVDEVDPTTHEPTGRRAPPPHEAR